MKTVVPIIAACFILAQTVPALATNKLAGHVYLIGEQDQLIPVKNRTVYIEGGNPDVTTSTGEFRIFLKDGMVPGEKITIRVDHPECQIYKPVGGEMRLPANFEKDIVRIILDKIGSIDS